MVCAYHTAILEYEAIFQDSLSLQTSQHQRPEISKTLKPLKSNEKNLSLASNFAFVDEQAGRSGVNTKEGTFYAATYGDNKVPVTLLLSPLPPMSQPGSQSQLGPGSHPENISANGAPLLEQQAHYEHQSETRSAFSLCPVTKFIDDSIPSRLISSNASTTGILLFLLLWVDGLSWEGFKIRWIFLTLF